MIGLNYHTVEKDLKEGRLPYKDLMIQECRIYHALRKLGSKVTRKIEDRQKANEERIQQAKLVPKKVLEEPGKVVLNESPSDQEKGDEPTLPVISRTEKEQKTEDIPIPENEWRKLSKKKLKLTDTRTHLWKKCSEDCDHRRYSMWFTKNKETGESERKERSKCTVQCCLPHHHEDWSIKHACVKHCDEKTWSQRTDKVYGTSVDIQSTLSQEDKGSQIKKELGKFKEPTTLSTTAEGTSSRKEKIEQDDPEAPKEKKSKTTEGHSDREVRIKAFRLEVQTDEDEEEENFDDHM